MSQRYIEDFTPGEAFVARTAALDEARIIAFAEEYDPQRIHTDPVYAAEEGPYGKLIASGFQTVPFAFRLYLDLGHFEGTSLGGPGMDEVRWLRPIHADEPMTPHVTVMEARRSSSRPERGFLRLGFDVRNGAGETALTFQTMSLIRARGA